MLKHYSLILKMDKIQIRIQMKRTSELKSNARLYLILKLSSTPPESNNCLNKIMSKAKTRY